MEIGSFFFVFVLIFLLNFNMDHQGILRESESANLHNLPEAVATCIADESKSRAEVDLDAEDEDKVKGRR